MGWEREEALELFKIDDAIPKESFDVVVFTFEWLRCLPVRFKVEVGGIFWCFPYRVRIWGVWVRKVQGSWDGVPVVAVI